MICYQDEKMYGPPTNGMTVQELDLEIEKLEKEIYGDNMTALKSTVDRKPMIYDVKTGRLVERE